MRVHDISTPLCDATPVWPGDPSPQITRASSMDRRDAANVTLMKINAHTGTHIDAPYHMIPGGQSVENIGFDVLMGEALVIRVEEAEALSADVLESLNIPSDTRRVLFRTRNSQRDRRKFRKNAVAVTRDGAHWLVSHGLRLVGIDYISIAPFDDPLEPHRILLRGGIVPLEGIILSHVESGFYELVCLPLLIPGADGAPARAILIEKGMSCRSKADG